ncbi:hypothetical protein LCGC14_2822040 [marine sediment metagenome]|uniref:Proton-coupled thiamine transporter YuaJ n=1 Tax=marine sediment metagenome TaxID=412755 RepID=A0A0F8YGP3_9ZZZZ
MEKMEKKLDAKTIAQVGITVALAVVLNLMPVFKMPQGGSVSLDMVPIFFLAFYRGPMVGILAGAVFGLVDYTIDPFFVHPAQLILDYPLAFGLVGIAGFVRGNTPISVATGVILGGTARFFAHLISGVIFFASYAPKGQNVWLYSAVYNGSYMLVSTLVAIPIVYALLRAFGKTGRQMSY